MQDSRFKLNFVASAQGCRVQPTGNKLDNGANVSTKLAVAGPESRAKAAHNQELTKCYEEIDQIYDYIRGLAPLPANLRRIKSIDFEQLERERRIQQQQQQQQQQQINQQQQNPVSSNGLPRLKGGHVAAGQLRAAVLRAKTSPAEPQRQTARARRSSPRDAKQQVPSERPAPSDRGAPSAAEVPSQQPKSSSRVAAAPPPQLLGPIRLTTSAAQSARPSIERVQQTSCAYFEPAQLVGAQLIDEDEDEEEDEDRDEGQSLEVPAARRASLAAPTSVQRGARLASQPASVSDANSALASSSSSEGPPSSSAASSSSEEEHAGGPEGREAAAPPRVRAELRAQLKGHSGSSAAASSASPSPRPEEASPEQPRSVAALSSSFIKCHYGRQQPASSRPPAASSKPPTTVPRADQRPPKGAQPEAPLVGVRTRRLGGKFLNGERLLSLIGLDSIGLTASNGDQQRRHKWPPKAPPAPSLRRAQHSLAALPNAVSAAPSPPPHFRQGPGSGLERRLLTSAAPPELSPGERPRRARYHFEHPIVSVHSLAGRSARRLSAPVLEGAAPSASGSAQPTRNSAGQQATSAASSSTSSYEAALKNDLDRRPADHAHQQQQPPRAKLATPSETGRRKSSSLSASSARQTHASSGSSSHQHSSSGAHAARHSSSGPPAWLGAPAAHQQPASQHHLIKVPKLSKQSHLINRPLPRIPAASAAPADHHQQHHGQQQQQLGRSPHSLRSGPQPLPPAVQLGRAPAPLGLAPANRAHRMLPQAHAGAPLSAGLGAATPTGTLNSRVSQASVGRAKPKPAPAPVCFVGCSASPAAALLHLLNNKRHVSGPKQHQQQQRRLQAHRPLEGRPLEPGSAPEDQRPAPAPLSTDLDRQESPAARGDQGGPQEHTRLPAKSQHRAGSAPRPGGHRSHSLAATASCSSSASHPSPTVTTYTSSGISSRLTTGGGTLTTAPASVATTSTSSSASTSGSSESSGPSCTDPAHARAASCSSSAASRSSNTSNHYETILKPTRSVPKLETRSRPSIATHRISKSGTTNQRGSSRASGSLGHLEPEDDECENVCQEPSRMHFGDSTTFGDTDDDLKLNLKRSNLRLFDEKFSAKFLDHQVASSNDSLLESIDFSGTLNSRHNNKLAAGVMPNPKSGGHRARS